MQGNPPQFDDQAPDQRRESKIALSDRSATSPAPKSLRVNSLSPSRLPKGFKSQIFEREDLSPTIKSRSKQHQSPSNRKVSETVSAAGIIRDPCADVMYLKQMLQGSFERLQEMESDKHERYERWKQGLR
jgi:hypothetical protein